MILIPGQALRRRWAEPGSASRAFGASLLLGVVSACGSPEEPASAAALAPYAEQRLGEVPDFELIDSTGAIVRRADLLGTPWVANLFFTSCGGPCPRVQAEIRDHLYAQLQGSGVRLVSISVDPATDHVQRIADYARSFGAEPSRWLYLTGTEEQIHRLVTTGLHLPVASNAVAADAASRLVERLEITHSTRLVAVDAQGKIAGYYGGGGETPAEEAPSAAEVEAALAALLARVRVLAGLTPSASILPSVDAALNALAATLLLLGIGAIRSGRREAHAWLMRAAFLVSTVFLLCYLTYHFTEVEARYQGTGLARKLYLGLLASHVLLAILVVPLVLRTLWLAHRQDWPRHKRLARWTFPIWLYVSVTGVVVYLLLYH